MKKVPGIYCIFHVHTQKRYIGSSIDIPARIRQHLFRLRGNRHENSYLQNDFLLSGEESFIITTLEETEDLSIRELHWSNYYQTLDPLKGYNIVPPKMASTKEEIERIRIRPTHGQILELGIPLLQIDLKTKKILEWASISRARSVYPGIRHAIWKSLNDKPELLTSQGSFWILKSLYFPELDIDSLLVRYGKRVPKPQKIAEPYMILRSPEGILHYPTSRKAASLISGIPAGRIAQLKLGYKVKKGKRLLINQVKDWTNVL